MADATAPGTVTARERAERLTKHLPTNYRITTSVEQEILAAESAAFERGAEQMRKAAIGCVTENPGYSARANSIRHSIRTLVLTPRKER